MTITFIDPADAERDAVCRFLRILAESENPEQRDFFLFATQLIAEGAHHAGDSSES
jgi:hypothetical protein